MIKYRLFSFFNNKFFIKFLWHSSVVAFLQEWCYSGCNVQHHDADCNEFFVFSTYVLQIGK